MAGTAGALAGAAALPPRGVTIAVKIQWLAPWHNGARLDRFLVERAAAPANPQAPPAWETLRECPTISEMTDVPPQELGRTWVYRVSARNRVRHRPAHLPNPPIRDDVCADARLWQVGWSATSPSVAVLLPPSERVDNEVLAETTAVFDEAAETAEREAKVYGATSLSPSHRQSPAAAAAAAAIIPPLPPIPPLPRPGRATESPQKANVPATLAGGTFFSFVPISGPLPSKMKTQRERR